MSDESGGELCVVAAGDLAEILSGLRQIAHNLDAARRETPDAQDATLANSAHHVHMVVERLAKQPEQPRAVAGSPSARNSNFVVDLLTEIQQYFTALVHGKTHDHLEYVRLRDACKDTVTLHRVADMFVPAPQPAVDPGVIGEIVLIVGMLNQHVVRADHIEKTEGVIGNAAKRLHAVLDRLPRTT